MLSLAYISGLVKVISGNHTCVAMPCCCFLGDMYIHIDEKEARHHPELPPIYAQTSPCPSRYVLGR